MLNVRGRAPQRCSRTRIFIWLMAVAGLWMLAGLPAAVAHKGAPGSRGAGRSAHPSHHGNPHATRGRGSSRSHGGGSPRAYGHSRSVPRSHPHHGKARHGRAVTAPPRGRALGHGRHGSPSGKRAGGHRTVTGRHGGEATSGRHAERGKVTICHATGSATNPYVEITISRNALKAHARHQDGRDLLSVPAGGCPTGAGSPVLEGDQGETSGEEG